MYKHTVYPTITSFIVIAVLFVSRYFPYEPVRIFVGAFLAVFAGLAFCIILWAATRKLLQFRPKDPPTKYAVVKTIIAGYLLNTVGAVVVFGFAAAIFALYVTFVLGIPHDEARLSQVAADYHLSEAFVIGVMIINVFSGYFTASIANRNEVMFGALSGAAILVHTVYDVILHGDAAQFSLSFIIEKPLPFAALFLGALGGYIRKLKVKAAVKYSK